MPIGDVMRVLSEMTDLTGEKTAARIKRANQLEDQQIEAQAGPLQQIMTTDPDPEARANAGNALRKLYSGKGKAAKQTIDWYEEAQPVRDAIGGIVSGKAQPPSAVQPNPTEANPAPEPSSANITATNPNAPSALGPPPGATAAAQRTLQHGPVSSFIAARMPAVNAAALERAGKLAELQEHPKAQAASDIEEARAASAEKIARIKSMKPGMMPGVIAGKDAVTMKDAEGNPLLDISGNTPDANHTYKVQHINGQPIALVPQLGSVLKQVLVIPPGAKEPIAGWVDPRNPGKIQDSAGGELPVGSKVLSDMEYRSMMYGEYGNYYRAALADPKIGNDADARAYASSMLEKKYNYQLAAQEQNMSINQALSGVSGIKNELPPKPGSNGSASSQTTPIPQPENKPVAPAKPSSSLPLSFSARDRQDVDAYLGSVFGTLPSGGIGGKAGAVSIRRGLDVIANKAGVDPMTLSAGLAQDKATAQQLQETIRRSGAIDRLQNTIEAHGTIMVDAIRKLHDSGSPLVNKPLREVIRLAASDPLYQQAQIAVNAVQREYAYLTAGGAQSRAMLPVSVNTTMDKLIDGGMTLGEAIAVVGQLGIETKAEMGAMGKTQTDLIQNLKTGVAGRAVGGGGSSRDTKLVGTDTYEKQEDGRWHKVKATP